MPQCMKAMWARLTPGTVCRALVCAAALGACLSIAAAGGADMARLVPFYLCAAVYLAGPGLALADWLGPHGAGLRAPLAMLYGIGLLAAVHCVAVRLGVVWLLRLLPAGITLVWAGRKLLRRRAAGQPLLCRPRLGAGFRDGIVLWAVLCLFQALMLGAADPHPLAAGPVVLHRDLLWNIGNATALSRQFPAQDIRFMGVRFSYHYLTELLTAALHLVSGASVFDIDIFFAGPLLLAGELLALSSLGRHYFGPERPRPTRLLVGLVFGCQSLAMWQVSPAGDGIFGNTLLKHLLTNVNAQGTALVMVCVFMALFITASRQRFDVGPLLLADMVAAFALFALAKGPQAAIVLCSLAITMVLVLLFQKPRYARALACLAGCAAAFLLLYQLLFAAGANESMRFSLFAQDGSLAYRYLSPYTDRLRQLLPFISGYVWLVGIWLINVFCMLPFQTLLWLTALPGTVRGLLRLDPARILANGVVAGGFLAYHLFSHSSSSEIYFALIGMIFLSLLAADRLDGLLAKRPLAWYKWPLWLAGGAAVLTAVCIVGACTRQGLGQMAATLGMAPGAQTVQAVTPADEEAMRWLQANTDAGLVFATDRTSAAPDFDNGISNVYTALSGRQAYMEGWTYAVTNMGVPRTEVQRRLEVLGALFDPGTGAQQVRGLCAAEGIGCIVDMKAWPGSVTPELAPAYENDGVAIYLLGG